MAIIKKGPFARAIGKGQAARAGQTDLFNRDLEQYTQQATKAGLAAITPQVRSGLANVSGYLGSAAAPLAGSGAALALQRSVLQPAVERLSGQVAGGAQDLLGDLIRKRVEERYKVAEEKRKKRDQKGGVGGFVGGALGAIGGPALSTIGKRIGEAI